MVLKIRISLYKEYFNIKRQKSNIIWMTENLTKIKNRISIKIFFLKLLISVNCIFREENFGKIIFESVIHFGSIEFGHLIIKTI